MNVIVKSRADLDKQSESTVEVVPLTKGSRLGRGLRALAICWGIAIFCILIPILHFVLVPLFLLIGILMFVQQYGQKYFFIAGAIQCPSCQTELKPSNGAFDWPKREICSHCRADLTLNEKI
jgi:hypothetical protein